MSCFIPVSTVDYTNKCSCVLFLNGCNFRCDYCYNKQTWTDTNLVALDIVLGYIDCSKSFVSSLVVSGGEPALQPEQLLEIVKYSKDIGLYVGIETNGYYTDILKGMEKYVDMFYIDVKAPIDDNIEYERVTHAANSANNVKKSLETLKNVEIRIVRTQNADKIYSSVSYLNKPTRYLSMVYRT